MRTQHASETGVSEKAEKESERVLASTHKEAQRESCPGLDCTRCTLAHENT